MNKIFKVIYSKVRNCYVVTSEFAKANTKSSTGSEKSKTGKKALLTLAVASAIMCGGWMNVGATVQSETISAGETTSNPVLTVDNTDDAAQLNKVISAAKEDKLLTKDNLSGQLTDYAKSSDVTEVKDAAKTLSNKIDNTDTGLNSKASTSLDNLTETGSDKIKELAKASVSSDLAGKTNQDMNNLSETGSNKIKELAKSAVDLTDFAKTEAVNESLENKADKSLGNIDADGEAKIKSVMKDSLDAKANTSDLEDYAKKDASNIDKDKYTAKLGTGEVAENNTELVTGGKVNAAIKSAVDAEKTAREQADAALETKVNGVIGTRTAGNYYTADDTIAESVTKVDQQVKKNTDAIGTRTAGNYYTADDTISESLTKLDQQTKSNTDAVAKETADRKTAIGELAEDKNYIKKDKNVSDNLVELDKQAKANADAVAKETADRKTAIGELAEDKNYIKKDKNVSDNLVELDKQAKANADAVAKETADRKTAIGELTEDKNYIKKDKNVSDNLVELDKQAKANADAVAKETADRKTAIGELTEDKNYIKKDKNVSDNLVELDKQAKANADDIKDTNGRTAGIKRDDVYNKTVIEEKVTIDQDGNISKVKDLGAETVTTFGNATIGRDLEVKKNTTLDGTLTAKGESTFKENVKVEKDLTVDGKLNVGGISMKNIAADSHGNNHDSSTTITADGISNTAKITDRDGKVTESKFTHDEKCSTTYAHEGDSTDWKETTSNVTADGVENIAKDSKGNNNTFTQTSTETKNILKDKDAKNTNEFTQTIIETKNTLKDEAGNTSSTRQDAKGNYGYAKDKDGNKSYTKQEGNRLAESVIGKDGKETKSEMTTTDITNTAKSGTIKNDAKDIVNSASGNISNRSTTMDTTVTGKATESYGELETTIKGNQSTTVEGNVTEDYKKNLTTTVGGDELHEVTGKMTENFKGGQETNVTGDQITTISGTQTTTATDINRNASSGMIDTINNAYGTNTETKVAGKTTTEVTIKGTGEKGEYIRGANEAKDTLTKGTLKNSETKTAEATSAEITDGSGNTSSTIQDKGQISGSVTNGTDKAVSNVKADSIDTAVTGAGSSSVINQKKDSITSSVGNGTTSTVIQQGEKDITIASNGGTVAIVGKDIINNATGNMTNIVGGNLTTTVTGKTTEEYKNGLDTTVTGDENHKVTGKQTNTIEGSQENIISGGQTNTITGDQNTTVTGDISNKAKNIVNTVDESITNNAKVINNKASEVINNEAVNINNKASGIISSSASEIKNQADKLISSKVGENTYQNIEDGKITESIKKGTKQNLTQSDAGKTEHSVVDGTNSSVTRQTSTTIEEAVTDGTNANASLKNASMSTETITNGTQANTVASTANGTTFTNSDASMALTEGGATNTTIKGNTITTGKVTMDYAEVMKDLGVKGNANITGKTTTGSLEVTGTSTLKGDVTMENNATVKKDLTVEGTTTTKDLHVTNNATVDGTLTVTKEATFQDSVTVAKDLSVGGNATITGDVTANSYKVGNNTYIDSNGINANGQVIRNVGAGEISETSTDAVNGSQLFATNRRIEQFDSRINEVGANAAAMANLHPMEFDADSKLNVAVGVGNYRNKTATAMGLFYRPNEDVMFNVSSTIGSSDNMIGGGVSFRLGSGGNKLKNKAFADAAEQNKQLKSQVDTLQAQMDALLSVINPNMSKDFPDVPNNHWAYEAVSRLAGNDIIQGYEDGKYHGERTMTRYEMAVIIYKALQKGAKAEAKLVEEFKPELKAIAAHEKA